MSAAGTRATVLVFGGSDPSGGAGIAADIEAIGALGAHALAVITALTVQDNDRVFSVHPVASTLVRDQAQALVDKMTIAAVKIGVLGDLANAMAVAEIVRALRKANPQLPVVLDPVLASGHGDALARGDAVAGVATLLPLATLVTPNLPEAAALCAPADQPAAQAAMLRQSGCSNVLIKGGHAAGNAPQLVNIWYGRDQAGGRWHWPRLPGSFHGSGCTLASAIAALLAQGMAMQPALVVAQSYCHEALKDAYAIAAGQLVPQRSLSMPPAPMALNTPIMHDCQYGQKISEEMK
ncbi:MAG: bifunctional hydroxymethylpyrimidine kinase/phosphomethylpyrimidine kinase [Janthinobacterium lividum]